MASGRYWKHPVGPYSDIKFHYHDIILEPDNWEYCNDADFIFYCAGTGRIDHFENFSHREIVQTIAVNAIAPISLISYLKTKLISEQALRLVVITSISGSLISPLFSLCGASKAFITNYIRSVNAELEKKSTTNRILEVAPGYIKGTSFYNDPTDLESLSEIAEVIALEAMLNTAFLVPQDSSLYQSLINEFHDDTESFASASYDYKLTKIEERSK